MKRSKSPTPDGAVLDRPGKRMKAEEEAEVSDTKDDKKEVKLPKTRRKKRSLDMIMSLPYDIFYLVSHYVEGTAFPCINDIGKDCLQFIPSRFAEHGSDRKIAAELAHVEVI